jgi:hypothetical protein
MPGEASLLPTSAADYHHDMIGQRLIGRPHPLNRQLCAVGVTPGVTVAATVHLQ